MEATAVDVLRTALVDQLLVEWVLVRSSSSTNNVIWYHVFFTCLLCRPTLCKAHREIRKRLPENQLNKEIIERITWNL